MYCKEKQELYYSLVKSLVHM